MNEVLNAIASRYSCRDFADTPLTDEELKALASAALASPSAMNRQPWRIVIVTDKKLIDEMDAEGMSILEKSDGKYHARMIERGGRLFYNTPCMVFALSDGSPYAPVDCGILIQSVALAAHSLGLGSVICGMAGMPLGGARGAEFKKCLGVPDGYDFCISALVGRVKSGKAPHELDPGKVAYI